MAEELEETKGSTDAWEELDLSDPDLDRISAIAAALGGATGGNSVEDPELADMGKAINQGVTTLDPEKIQEGLEGVSDHCASR